ncbi:MAG: hypothetical protein JWR05_64, partial [Mucilaginibacter sp.]|nr:hypothetical protein [Mucilaginibacter sp.]
TEWRRFRQQHPQVIKPVNFTEYGVLVHLISELED